MVSCDIEGLLNQYIDGAMESRNVIEKYVEIQNKLFFSDSSVIRTVIHVMKDKRYKYNMPINRDPEVALAEILHTMDKFYNENKISVNNLIAYHDIKLSKNSQENLNLPEIYIFDVIFNAPNKGKMNLIQINNYISTLKQLKVKNLQKKYVKNGELDKNDDFKKEIYEFSKSLFVAKHNPMVYGKCINQAFTDEKVEEFGKLEIEEQNKIIRQLIAPVDSKLILKQAVIKLDKDMEFIDNGENVMLIKNENGVIQNKIPKKNINRMFNLIKPKLDYIMSRSYNVNMKVTNYQLDIESIPEYLHRVKDMKEISEAYEKSADSIQEKIKALNRFSHKNKNKNCGKSKNM